MVATPLRIVCLLFPNVTQLDLTGPAQVLARIPNAEVHLVWHDLAPVATDCGWSIVPTTTFDDAPQADVLFVPGGDGAFECFDDAVVLDFLRRQAAGAQWVTSVCTGSFALAAAGLLAGKRATSHWASLPMLSEFGAIPVRERVVVDGNLMTGAGVTSGIDFAFTLAGLIAGEEEARRIQLALEYDPAPPFNAGSPDDADPSVVDSFRAAVAEKRMPRVAAAVARLNQIGGRETSAGPKKTADSVVTLIRSAQLSDRAEYAYAATAPADARIVYLAGACPLGSDGSTAGVGDYAAQARKAVENMLVALDAAGAGIDDVISTRVLVASSRQSDLGTAWNVVRAAFGDHDVPSTLLGVTVLGYDDQLVEIECVAAVRD